MPRRKVADPYAMKVGARLRAVRKQRGLSIVALAKASGVSKGWISNTERGFVMITGRRLAALARGLQVPAFYLLTFAEEDDRAAIAESLVSLPAHEQQELIGWIREAARDPEPPAGA
jgi:transcriptional regulator with XRE-family HTH domain